MHLKQHVGSHDHTLSIKGSIPILNYRSWVLKWVWVIMVWYMEYHGMLFRYIIASMCPHDVPRSPRSPRRQFALQRNSAKSVPVQAWDRILEIEYDMFPDGNCIYSISLGKNLWHREVNNLFMENECWIAHLWLIYILDMVIFHGYSMLYCP